MRAAQKRAGGTKFFGAAQAFGGMFGDAGLADGVGIATFALGLGAKLPARPSTVWRMISMGVACLRRAVKRTPANGLKIKNRLGYP